MDNRHFLCQSRENLALALYSGLPLEGGADHIKPEMTLPAAIIPRMARMFMAIIDQFKALRRKNGFQFGLNGVGEAHI